MLDTARINAKTIVKENTPTKSLSTFQFTWELGKLLVRSYIQQHFTINYFTKHVFNGHVTFLWGAKVKNIMKKAIFMLFLLGSFSQFWLKEL